MEDHPHRFAILMRDPEGIAWLAAIEGETRFFPDSTTAERERERINGDSVVLVYGGKTC